MDLNTDEKIALYTAIIKTLKEELDFCKNKAKADLIELYNQTGANRRQLKIGDKVVGTISCEQRKPKIVPTDEGLKYLEKQGLTEVKPVRDWQSCFIVDEDNGVIADCATGEDVSELFNVYDGQIVCPVRGIKAHEVAKAMEKAFYAPEITYLLESGD